MWLAVTSLVFLIFLIEDKVKSIWLQIVLFLVLIALIALLFTGVVIPHDILT